MCILKQAILQAEALNC